MGNIFPCLESGERPQKTSTTVKTSTTSAQMGNIHSSQQVDEKDKTILKLKMQQDKLLAKKKALYQNADKAQQEAKQFIVEKKKERAMFALKRKKLFDQYATETENQYTILQKTIIQVESAIDTAKYVEVLKESNQLLNEIDVASQLETLEEVGQDMKEREDRTRQFNKMFEEHHVEDVDDLFNQFEKEVAQEDMDKEIEKVNKTQVDKSPVSNSDVVVVHQDNLSEDVQVVHSDHESNKTDDYEVVEKEGDQNIEKQLMAMTN